MKTLLALLLHLLVLTTLAIASIGPGPWASGAYYPGGTDGKYQAAAYGKNITGVIGFAIREGSPTVLQQTNAAAGGGGGGTNASPSFSIATAAAQAFDATQNYFVIFVEGRTYSGLTVGSVNPVGKTVTGAMLGSQPDFSYNTNSSNSFITIDTIPGVVTTNVTNTVTTNIQTTIVGNITNSFTNITTNIVSVVTINDPIVITNTNSTQLIDPLPILNRGLSGGFQAKLKNNKAYMTFRGDGELSTPAQLQTVDLLTDPAGNNISGTIQTHTVSFKVDGLRTSFLTTFAPVAPTAQ